jgi:hypothetical protein
VDDPVPPEVLHCSAFRHLIEAPMIDDPIEVVRSGECGRLLRRRRRLSEADRAQSPAWRWAAAQFACYLSTERVDRRPRLSSVALLPGAVN